MTLERLRILEGGLSHIPGQGRALRADASLPDTSHVLVSRSLCHSTAMVGPDVKGFCEFKIDQPADGTNSESSNRNETRQQVLVINRI